MFVFCFLLPVTGSVFLWNWILLYSYNRTTNWTDHTSIYFLLSGMLLEYKCTFYVYIMLLQTDVFYLSQLH